MAVHTALGFGTELLRYAQSGLSDCLGMTERGERRMSSASCRIAGSLPGGWLSIAYLLLLALSLGRRSRFLLIQTRSMAVATLSGREGLQGIVCMLHMTRY